MNIDDAVKQFEQFRDSQFHLYASSNGVRLWYGTTHFVVGDTDGKNCKTFMTPKSAFEEYFRRGGELIEVSDQPVIDLEGVQVADPDLSSLIPRLMDHRMRVSIGYDFFWATDIVVAVRIAGIGWILIEVIDEKIVSSGYLNILAWMKDNDVCASTIEKFEKLPGRHRIG